MATRIPDADAIAIIRKGAARIVQVSEDAVGEAIRATAPHHAQHGRARRGDRARSPPRCRKSEKLRGKRVGLILSGGNIDFDLFRQMGEPDSRQQQRGAGMRMDAATTISAVIVRHSRTTERRRFRSPMRTIQYSATPRRDHERLRHTGGVTNKRLMGTLR